MVGRNILEDPQSNNFEIISPSHSDLDLLDQRAVSLYFEQMKPDVVVHAAGRVGGIQANIAEPVRFFVDNMTMGINVVLAAREAGTKRLLNIGSSCMYPKNAANPLSEASILAGELEPTNEGYALAKIACARLCDYIHRENELYEYKTVIPCNLYGRHDKFQTQKSHMIPAVIRKIDDAIRENADTVEIWGTGEARREFMYAGDLASFIFFAIEHFEKIPSTINVGIGEDLSINEYYEEVAFALGYKGQFTHNLAMPVGMTQKLVDVRRMRGLGWAPQVSLRDGIVLAHKFYQTEFKND